MPRRCSEWKLISRDVSTSIEQSRSFPKIGQQAILAKDNEARQRGQTGRRRPARRPRPTQGWSPRQPAYARRPVAWRWPWQSAQAPPYPIPRGWNPAYGPYPSYARPPYARPQPIPRPAGRRELLAQGRRDELADIRLPESADISADVAPDVHIVLHALELREGDEGDVPQRVLPNLRVFGHAGVVWLVVSEARPRMARPTARLAFE